MAPEQTPVPNGPNENDNKYMRVLELAWARKRNRGSLDDDYRRPLYEPAQPPASDDGSGGSGR
jgi:hypothetical protein